MTVWIPVNENTARIQPEKTLASLSKPSSSKVYWLVKDHYDLSYRVPESWELFYYKKNKWMPVLNDTPYSCFVHSLKIRLLSLLNKQSNSNIWFFVLQF